MMGVAAGGGLLLASLSRRSKSTRYFSEHWSDLASAHRRGTELQKNKALEAFDTIKGARIAVAASTFQDFLGQIIPGFKEQFHKTEQEKHAAGCLERLVPRRQPQPSLELGLRDLASCGTISSKGVELPSE